MVKIRNQLPFALSLVDYTLKMQVVEQAVLSEFANVLPQVVFDAQKSLFGFRRWVMDPHMYNNNMYLQMYTCVHDSLMKPCMKQCIKYFYKILQVTVQSFVTCFPISISRAPLLPKLCDSASDLQPPIFMFTWLG